jgi:hypothetical protein
MFGTHIQKCIVGRRQRTLSSHGLHCNCYCLPQVLRRLQPSKHRRNNVQQRSMWNGTDMEKLSFGGGGHQFVRRIRRFSGYAGSSLCARQCESEEIGTVRSSGFGISIFWINGELHNLER